MQFAGAVLTGGASRRFGSDKALARAGERLLGARVVAALRGAGIDPVVAVGGTAGNVLGLITIADVDPGGGPLPAMATLLSWFGRGHVVVCPCDLPLLLPEHVATLVAGLCELARTDGADVAAHTAVVARVAGRLEPSFGIWPTAWAVAARRHVANGSRAFRDALELGPHLAVDLPAEALIDADTPASLREALRLEL